MFRKVLIASRGATACRIMRTLRDMSVGSVAVYLEANRHSLYVQQADEALLIEPQRASEDYFSTEAILEAARRSGAEAIHPGDGFLSDSAALAQACADSGLTFIGPRPEQIRAFRSKLTARSNALEAGVAPLPGTDLLTGVRETVKAGGKIGYPVVLKSAVSGSRAGIRMCRSPEELVDAYEQVVARNRRSMGNRGFYLEKFVACARHIEVPIFGDGKGAVIALGDRDCSPQRHSHKVIGETPAPGLRHSLREKMSAAAICLGEAVKYRSAGTVEFIYDTKTEDFNFLGMKMRLQAEHGVTEEVTGIDLVEWMVRQAAGELPALDQILIRPTGCSVAARIYAENPAENFDSSSGTLSHVLWPIQARVDAGVETGAEVAPHDDPLLASIIVHGESRTAALENLSNALKHTAIAGIETNLAYLRQVAADPGFKAGGMLTSFLEAFEYQRSTIDVVESGAHTTVQDYPGRSGYWHVGVPPSGPMDPLAFRIANRLVGNLDSLPALEIAGAGPTLRFASDVLIALTGADFGARLDDVRVPPWRSILVSPGSTLAMTTRPAVGSRAYLAVSGGLAVPEYLESCSTFAAGGFGGHAGRALRAGDVLEVAENGPLFGLARKAPSELVPQYAWKWEIGVLFGPHGAPDYFTAEDIERFFSTSWTVDADPGRTGVRLIGPKPGWVREGGVAATQPSNAPPRAYAIGTVQLAGDSPVILGPDGVSQGGFVSPATIVHAELWKMGQLKPGDRVRFRAISKDQAASMEEQMETAIAELAGSLPGLPRSGEREEPVLARREGSHPGPPAVVYRADGDRHLLIEYGDNALDLGLRCRVHALEEGLHAAMLPGILDITPGIRSLQVHYDVRVLSREHLLEALDACEEQLPDLDDLVLPSRVLHLPLSWEDDPTAGDLEFLRCSNGLEPIDKVRRIVSEASYLVLGLGAGYLGAPVASALDPRHRLIASKTNSARTWTPDNAVAISGAYLNVSAKDRGEGYQVIGRTVQMWNTFRTTAEFQLGAPWLLRNFDQIRFFPVTSKELLEIRDAFPYGRYPLRMEAEYFRLREYNEFLASIADDAAEFQRRQQEALLADSERSGLTEQAKGDPDMPEGYRAVRAPATASVWTVAVQPGQRVTAGQKLIVLKAMKMEIAVAAPFAGIIEVLHCVKGAMVSAGQNLVILRPEPSS